MPEYYILSDILYDYVIKSVHLKTYMPCCLEITQWMKKTQGES
jgi:hypothetical protein